MHSRKPKILYEALVHYKLEVKLPYQTDLLVQVKLPPEKRVLEIRRIKSTTAIWNQTISTPCKA